MAEHGMPLMQVRFPLGFEAFHPSAFINYQLNRVYALGFADPGELREAGTHVRSPGDCVAVFGELAERASGVGRLQHAAGYMRVAEFFTPRGAPEKLRRYLRYRELFDAAFATDGLVRHEVPYRGRALPAYRLTSAERPGPTILVHGGFDSLIEEFTGIWSRIAAAGFDVIAFDGPGQGGARRLGGLLFEHDWEQPVGAVLDHFGIESAGLVGISMGGYWALRAAGREPRIDRVVAWPPVYDWMVRVPRPLRGATRAMLRQRRLMRLSVRVRARRFASLGRVVDQALYNVGSDDPMDVVDWFLGMNAEHLASERVTQPVLLMCGENDAFQPPILAHAQRAALTSAQSVTMRTFTRAEYADQHCQMGNLELACAVITRWLSRPGSSDLP